MKECRNCKYARKAENPEYIGCSAAAGQDEVDYFKFYERKEISTGWVNLQSYPGITQGFGIITNGIPCFKPNDSCKHYEERRA